MPKISFRRVELFTKKWQHFLYDAVFELVAMTGIQGV